MARQASSKSADSTAALGCERLIRSFGIRHSGLAISCARRLAIMNLAIRGIEADFGPEDADTFRRTVHPELRADCAIKRRKAYG